MAAGGSRAITDAMAAVLHKHGATITTGVRVSSAAQLSDADVVLFDLAPGAVADILGDRLPARVARAYRGFRHGPGAFKVDFAVHDGVPWTNEAARLAMEQSDPIEDDRGPVDYKRAMVRELTRRALRRASARIQGGAA